MNASKELVKNDLKSLLGWDFAAGFYIVWGCLVWVPSVYTSPALYLVNHPVELGTPVYFITIFFFLLGALAVMSL